MGSLVDQGSAFPESSSAIDDEVIADVTGLEAIDMRRADGFHAIACREGIIEPDGSPALVMAGDAVDAVHGQDACGNGRFGGPAGPGQRVECCCHG